MTTNRTSCNYAEALGPYVNTERHPTRTLPTGLLARRNSNEAIGPIVFIELASIEVEALRFITEARQQSSLTHTLFNPFEG